MKIRVLDASDVAEYRKIRLHALKVDPDAYGSIYENELNKPTEQFVSERLTPTEGNFTLGVFDTDDKMVGIGTFVRETKPKVRHKGNVYGVFVTPELRGNGIGKALMLTLIELASKCNGLEQINLKVVSSNESARRLYSSVGFEIYGVERNAFKYHGEYFDDDLMVLHFSALSAGNFRRL